MRLLLVKDDHSHSDDEYSPHLKIAAAAKRGVSSYITSLQNSRYKSDRPSHISMPYSACLVFTYETVLSAGATYFCRTSPSQELISQKEDVLSLSISLCLSQAS